MTDPQKSQNEGQKSQMSKQSNNFRTCDERTYEMQQRFIEVCTRLAEKDSVATRRTPRVLDDAQAIFRKAGVDLPSFSGGNYTNRGLPGRDSVIRLFEQWDHAQDDWVMAESWDQATRLAQVRSKQALKGAKDADGVPRDAFNVRQQRSKKPGRFSYGPVRLFVDQEGSTWRWVT